MLFLILFGLCILAGVVVVVGETIDFGWNWSTFDYAVIGFVFVGGIASLIVSLIVGAIFGLHPYYSESYNLQQISTDKSLHGDFFLGIGSVDDERSYEFYRVNPDGSFSMDSIPVDEATIVEDSSQPHIDHYTSAMRSWVLPGGPNGMRAFDDSYVIHVPAGSIAPMVDLNLK